VLPVTGLHRLEIRRMSSSFLDLKRYPDSKRGGLQAWDRADELLRMHIDSLDVKGKRLLVLNDTFGAISTHLIGTNLTVYTDSYLSDRAIRMNSNNEIAPIHSLASLDGLYDYVFYRFPKNLSFFEDQLCVLSRHLSQGASLIGTSMVKHLPSGAFKLLERITGKTSTSLAEKKARLVFAKFENGIAKNPYPLQVKVDSFEHPFINASNLFSREKLDQGTRFFLEWIPAGTFARILDLGCANGIIGIGAKRKNPQARILFSDESAMAVESAKANYRNYFADDAEFFWTNCFQGQAKESADLVLCNPPFHQGTLVLDDVAEQMFRDAFVTLKRGGLLRVIGNGHLQYPHTLKRIFGNGKILGANAKFVVIEAVKV